jgi:hypothetical protein
MRNLVSRLLFGIILIIFAGFGFPRDYVNSATPTIHPTSTPKPTSTLHPTSIPRPSSSSKPTSTPRLTSTPNPTSTPRPTLTPRPTSTPKATPTPTQPTSNDLAVIATNLSFTGMNLKGGDKTTLKAVINNYGTATAKNFKVRFLADDTKIYEKTITSLSKNSKTTISYSYQIPANAQTEFIYGVIIDPENSISESNETNNTASVAVSVNPAIRNLFIESFLPSDTNPKPGQNIFWNFKIKNVANSKAEQVKIALFADANSATPTATLIIPTMSMNTSVSKSIPWTVPTHIDNTMNFLVRAIVDPDNAIIETNELDNYKNYTLSLTVPDISIVPGQYMTLTGNQPSGMFSQLPVVVKNNNFQAVSNLKVGVYYTLNNSSATRTKITETTMNLEKNASQSYLFDRILLPTEAAIGSVVYMFITVDPDNNIPESDKTNNELALTRTVIQKPPQITGSYVDFTVEDEDGNKLNGATVTLTNNNASGNILSKITGTDILVHNASGVVVFDNLSATGRYTVSIALNTYRTQTETFDFDKDKEETVYRNYILDKRAVLSGTVKNNSGQPLQWVSVKVDGTNLETVTDSQGKYGFMLNGGTYSVRFLKTGFARIVENNFSVPALQTITLNKSLSPTTSAYLSGSVNDDEGVGLANVDIYVNGNMIGTTANDGHFNFNNTSTGTKNFKFKKPGFVDTEFTQEIEAGNEYNLSFVMFKPSTDTHVERGTEIVSWHQHEGTPANAFFVPEYNVDVWWGLGRVKMALDFTKTGDTAKLTKLVINNHGNQWECNKVEGEGDIETSAIDIPITISAGSCSVSKTQMDVYKVAIESDGNEVFADPGFWTSASDPMNTGTRTITINNLQVAWNNNFKVKMWVRVQKRAVVGIDGDGSGALYGYHMDRKLITWYPQKPPTTVISTSWGQVGNYLLGILDNPVTAITSFSDLYTVEHYNTYTMSEVLSNDFPGSPPEN